MPHSPHPRRQSGRRKALFASLSVILLFCAIAASISVGARIVAWGEIWAALSGPSDSLDHLAVANRIPRTLMGVLAGAALGMSGAAMQGVTRNPLADPGILGVNMGASLAIVIAVAWFGIEALHAYILSALIGAAAAAVFVYTVASFGPGGASPLKLALAGAATSMAFGAFVVAITLPRGDIAGGLKLWQIGGISGATYAKLTAMVPCFILGALLCLGSSRKLNALALGDEMAAGLGEKVAQARSIASLGAVALCGVTTAICGPIGFVGLILPHACRIAFGNDYRWIMPFSALGGGVLLLMSDVVGRMIARPAEIDVAILTAFIGAPVFIFILRARRIAAV